MKLMFLLNKVFANELEQLQTLISFAPILGVNLGKRPRDYIKSPQIKLEHRFLFFVL